MSAPNKSFPEIDNTWMLFLDRDGVINRRIEGDYVRETSQFEWLPGVLEALAALKERFGTIVVASNQQGIGKGLMTEADVQAVHGYMKQEIEKAGGRLDAVYFCGDLADSASPDRKPESGMAFRARKDFPHIDFHKSVMVGDAATDMEFAKRLGMTSVFVGGHAQATELTDFVVEDLKAFVEML